MITFVLSAAEWINKTNAIGLYVKRGKYGGTYAHKDIAFEFASAISSVFKLYLIKEFQRLKEEENNSEQKEWDAKRFLSKNNYLIQTDAVKKIFASSNELQGKLSMVEVMLPNGSTGQLLDIMDYISNSFMMPFIALLSAIFIGWVMKPDWIAEEMELGGKHFGRKRLYVVMSKYILPVIMLILFLQSTGILNNF